MFIKLAKLNIAHQILNSNYNGQEIEYTVENNDGEYFDGI